MHYSGATRQSSRPRLNRLLAEDGKCFDVAIDHGFFNEVSFLQGIEDMESVIHTIVQANPDAVQLSPGQAEILQSIPGRSKPALVLRTDVTNVYGSPPPEYLFSQLIDQPVQTALRLDAACVVVNILKIAGYDELYHQCIKNVMALRAECDRYGMPLMVEPLCMKIGKDVPKYGVNGDPAEIIPLVRQAVELGADIIKADPTNDPNDYHKVIQVAAGKPVLVRGGAVASEKEIFERTAMLLQQGARGIVYGRNVIQHPHPQKITEAFMALVHKGVSPSEAASMIPRSSPSSSSLPSPFAGRQPDVKKEKEKEKDKGDLEKPSSIKKPRTPVDPHCQLPDAEIVEDYYCILNQTNIAQNNNKFYLLQLLRSGGTYYVYSRWGRVGETGANMRKVMSTKEMAVNSFKAHFLSKTGNEWDDRKQFVPKSGKFTLIQMDLDQEEDELDWPSSSSASSSSSSSSSTSSSSSSSDLPEATQSLLRFLFDSNTYTLGMAVIDLDIRKFPLGRLSKECVAKVSEVVEKMADVITNGGDDKRRLLGDLSNMLYTILPHNFGRSMPPLIDSMELVAKYRDRLAVLSNILQIVPLLQVSEKDRPLGAIIDPLSDRHGAEWELVQNYYNASAKQIFGGKPAEIDEIYKVRVLAEDTRFSASSGHLSNRKLLWYGTPTASVAAFLTTGLHIQSPGRLGKGLAFFDQSLKAAHYMQPIGGASFMFLCEVALGKEYEVRKDDTSLVAPPAGYDSVVARGLRGPDPSKNLVVQLDGEDVVVPLGEPISCTDAKDSNFLDHEYVIYSEGQCRIRYLLKFRL